MEQNNTDSKRRKLTKRQRFMRNYGPTIRLGLCIVCLVLVIGIAIRVIGGNERLHSSEDGTEGTAETTVETTASVEQLQHDVDLLIEKADFIAAGYDYAGAIEMLRSYEYYNDFPELAQKISDYQLLDSQLVSYPEMNNITHIFFHSLIADTSRAFDGEYTEDGYNLYMTTVDEFNAMLQQMYDRGHVLVTPYDVAYEVTDSTGTHFTYGDIRLPEGKIPFIMSQDDLNYYGYMISGEDVTDELPARPSKDGDGFAHKIVIGEDGYPTCEYMDANGNITTGDYDLVPALETFIQNHPDFAYHGARAVLGMTGYEGVFGYRTKPSYEAILGADAYAEELRQAREVAQCLRDHGWVLASHSYGHPAYGDKTAAEVEADSDKWENTVQPVIGDTDVLLYPYGSDIAGIEKYTTDNAKFNALYADGYRYFFNVDGNYAWCQLADQYFRGGRRNLDGYRMYHNPQWLDDLFDTATVFDKARPTPVPSI